MKSSQVFLRETVTTAPKRNVENGSDLRIFAITAMAALALSAENAILRYVAIAITSGTSRGIALPMQLQLNLRK